MYTLDSALAHLKMLIDKLEKEIEQEKSPSKRAVLRNLQYFHLESGITCIRMARPDELDQGMIDWFFGRIKERPDLKEIEELCKDEG